MTTSGRRETVVAASVYLAIFAALSVTLLLKHEPGDGSDYWTHLAAIRTLSEGGEPAQLPLAGDAPLRQRYHDPYHAAWALALRHTPLSGTDVMALAGIINIAVFLAGLAFLASRFGPPALAALCFLVVMLFMWGLGYGWSNEYYLSIMPGVGPFPSTLAWGLSFFVLGLLETWSRRGGRLRLVGAMLLGASVAAIHPLTALMFTLTFPILWVWLGRTTWRMRWLALAFPATALLLSLAWRYTSLFAQLKAVLSDGQPGAGPTGKALAFLSPGQLLLALGPVPAGVFFLPCVARRRRLPLAAGMVVYALAWVSASLIGISLGHRFVFFLVFVLHLTIALSLLSGWRLWRHRRRLVPSAPWSMARVPAAVVACAMLLIPWAPLHAFRLASLAGSRLDRRTLSLGPSSLVQFEATCTQLRAGMPPGGRFLTDRATATQLAAFGLPIVPEGGLGMEPPAGVGPTFIRRVTRKAEETGGTHLLIRLGDLGPSQLRLLAELGTVSQMPPDVVVVRLKGPDNQGAGGSRPSAS